MQIGQPLLVSLGGELTISGSGFGEPSEDNAVYIGTQMTNIESWTDTSITVTAPAQSPSTYTVSAYIHPVGYADLRYDMILSIHLCFIDKILACKVGNVF